MKNFWKPTLVMLSLMFVGVAFTSVHAQDGERGPRGPRDGEGRPGGDRQFNPEQMIERIMQLDKDGDGKITKEEVEGTRAAGMIERADANKDGAVTKEELKAMFQRGPGGRPGFARDGDRPGPPRGEGDRERMREGDRPGPPRDGDRGPREGDRASRDGDRGPRDGDRPSFAGGPRPPMDPSMMPWAVMEGLHLSDDQRRQLRALHEEVQKKFHSILTEEQREKLHHMGPPRPGFGGPGFAGAGGPRPGMERGRDGDRREGGPQARGPRDGDRPQFRGPRDGDRGPRVPRDRDGDDDKEDKDDDA
ncbi:EF-hand domain-containing protein [bacterium]|nr:EF-hand domain-containing protein [bacterium]